MDVENDTNSIYLSDEIKWGIVISPKILQREVQRFHGHVQSVEQGHNFKDTQKI